MASRNDFKPVRKAVFPVAGLGTRFLPATKAMPKEMLPLNGKPLIQHACEEAMAAGIEEFIFVTGRQKEILTGHFESQPALEQTLEMRGKTDLLEKVRAAHIPAGKLKTVDQPEALGLGHAIWCARDLVGDEPFAVFLPDDVFLAKTPCMAQMMEAYNETGGNIVAVTAVSKADTARYGILDVKSDNGRIVEINGLVEKPGPEKAPSTTAIMGRYILQPEIFEPLSVFEKGAGGEIQLTDAIVKLIDSQPVYGFHYDGQRYDCGTHFGFIESNAAYALADPEIGTQVRDTLKNLLNGKDKQNVAA